MCNGNKEKEARRKAKEEEKKQRRLAEQRQRELDTLAAQRQAIADQQAAQRASLQRQADANAAAARQRSEALRQQYSSQMSALQSEQQQQLAAINKETAEIKRQGEIDVRNLNTTNQAITSSLRILSRGTTNRAPNAQQSKRGDRTTGAKTTSTGLRIGSQPSSSGANIAT